MIPPHRESDLRKVVITGAAGYFGTVLIPRILAGGETEEIVGIDLKRPSVGERRLRSLALDLRDPKLEEVFRGADAIVHLGYIVAEIRNKRESHDINIHGTKNVVTRAARAGVPHIVIASSVAAYGSHPDNPLLIREGDRLRGNLGCYYSYDKAAVERDLDAAEVKFPELVVTRLRPCTIVGPRASHPLAALAKRRRVLFPRGHDPRIQLLYEEDLAEGFYQALRSRRAGAFNLAPDDSLPWIELMH
ncbi:MAG: NAD-dependent epimerase/dehydratase family protein, partial [Candidatus Omnitrophota bacterium]